MLFILGWIIYGLIVGCIAKLIHPEEDLVGFLPTVGVGIAGSFIGGFLSWLIGAGASPFEPSGIVMGVVGGVIVCWLWRTYRLNRFFKAQGRMPQFRLKK